VSKTKSKLHLEVSRARQRRDAEILRRAGKGDSHEKIAEDLGMTRQRVGQIIKASKPPAA
jgi:biotin operon repressor